MMAGSGGGAGQPVPLSSFGGGVDAGRPAGAGSMLAGPPAHQKKKFTFHLHSSPYQFPDRFAILSGRRYFHLSNTKKIFFFACIPRFFIRRPNTCLRVIFLLTGGELMKIKGTLKFGARRGDTHPT